MKFETSNSELIIPYLIIIGISVLSAIYVTRHKKEKIESYLLWSIGLFLLVYFPILEYWSIWTSWSIWPNDFSPENQSILSDTGNSTFEQYSILKIVFHILNMVSEILLIFSIILFISIINTTVKGKNKILNWIPFLNIFNIGRILNKMFEFKWNFKIATVLWIIFTLLWVYYRFLAFPLYLIDFDSITFIDEILFPNIEEVNNFEISYTFVSDILKIIIPVFLFISGILTLIIVKKIKNTCANTVYN